MKSIPKAGLRASRERHADHVPTVGYTQGADLCGSMKGTRITCRYDTAPGPGSVGDGMHASGHGYLADGPDW